MMNENMIKRFEENGFKRWTKYDMDRLYINAEALGLYVDRYNTGNISYAKFRGEEISNNYAREMINSKIWIDISTGKLMYKSGSCSTIVQAAQDLMDEIIEQYEQEQAQAIEEGADNENAENDACAVPELPELPKLPEYMYVYDVHEFTKIMFDNSVDFPPVPYTRKKAMYDLKNWNADELDVPYELTIMRLVAEMNHLIGEYVMLNGLTDRYVRDRRGIWRNRSDL